MGRSNASCANKCKVLDIEKKILDTDKYILLRCVDSTNQSSSR